MDLTALTLGYLNAHGYENSQRGRDLIIGRKKAEGQDEQVMLVWIPTVDTRNPFQSQEGPYLSRFQQLITEYPSARRFMLVPSFEQMTPGFRQAAKQVFNVNIRIPIQFFDTSFKWDESELAPSAALELRRRGDEAPRRRIPQPFVLGGKAQGDLLDALLSRLQQQPEPDEKNVHIVIGPAGFGKSFLFEALFSRLYGDFMADKRSLVVVPRPRPLPLMPEYLQSSIAATLPALVDAFIATDFSAPISRPAFEWMLTSGYGVWLMDGLDEVIARDDRFFPYILRILETSGTVPARILICARDSLLATNDELRDFCEGQTARVELYELTKWDMPSKRQFAKKTLRGKAADGFLTCLKDNPTFAELSGTPFYCDLLAAEYRENPDNLTTVLTESRLLDRLIEREYGKGLLDPELVPIKDVMDFLQALAADDLEGGFEGVQRESVSEWARLLLPEGLTESDLDRFVAHLTQIALFSRGAQAGRVRFAHEILEHYLLGKQLIHSYAANPDMFTQRLSLRQVPSDWITLRIVADAIREQGKMEELNHLLWKGIPSVAFKNVLQIFLFARPDAASLKDISFDRRDLAGIIFQHLDLRGSGFRGADLTDTEFDGTNLRNTSFEGAILKNTVFLLKNEQDLSGAELGELERFYSIRTKAGIITDLVQARKWLEEHTGKKTPAIEPCGAAKQLRYIFGKFIHPTGEPKRVMIDRMGILSGRPIYLPEKTVKVALKDGYLRQDNRFRDRFQRADGDVYDEMVAYVKDLTISQDLRTLLDDLCPSAKCFHVSTRRG